MNDTWKTWEGPLLICSCGKGFLETSELRRHQQAPHDGSSGEHRAIYENEALFFRALTLLGDTVQRSGNARAFAAFAMGTMRAIAWEAGYTESELESMGYGLPRAD